MNKREKILVTIVGSIVAVIVVGFGVRAALIKPLKEIDNRIKAEISRFLGPEDKKVAGTH